MLTVLTFNAGVFLGAALLFLIQPMVAQMLLPLFGGSAAVWTVCVVTYQTLLLGGYLYAHALTRWVHGRWHFVLHVALLAVAVAVLPIHIVRNVSSSAVSTAPVSSLLSILIPAVGLPFVVLAATGPLLQVWFAGTRHPSAGDPYFLYSASNLGSLAGLLSFPVLLEPLFPIMVRTRIWAAAYGMLIALVIGCAVLALMRHRTPKGADYSLESSTASERLRLSRVRLLLLAFVPASLTLGITTFILTNLAAVPLFWVVPLALYLLSFVVAFSVRQVIPHRFVVQIVPAVLLLVVVLYLFGFDDPWWIIIPAHLVMLFGAALMCHGELARARPPASELTTFYLWISFGGVLGGLLNACAPFLFNTVIEYPLAMTLVALLVPALPARRDFRALFLDIASAVGVGALTAVLIVAVTRWIAAGPLGAVLMFGPPALICHTFRRQAVRFAAAVALMMAAYAVAFPSGGGVRLARERSFFGVLQVRDRNGYHTLYHGNTIHGIQSPVPERRQEPLAYYHRTSPIGEIFQTYAADLSDQAIALVGLGVGSLTGYAQPGQHWTFYELDPMVLRIAQDPRLFTFLSASRAPFDLVLGDARISMKDAAPAHNHLIVLDAFSSDAVPVHLLTREALQLYLSKLNDGGLLAFHVSNRYLSLKPLLAAAARDSTLVALTRDGRITPMDARQGKLPSEWVVMARQPEDLERLTRDARWKRLEPPPGMRAWSDDHADIFSVLAFR